MILSPESVEDHLFVDISVKGYLETSFQKKCGNQESEEMTMMMWGYGYGWSMLWMVFWNLLWLVLLGLLIWGVVRWLGGRTVRPASHDSGSPPHSALDILQERYARGEIDETTFERMRERLMASSPEGQRSTEHGQMR
jgi:uncharacterized membrane protein